MVWGGVVRLVWWCGSLAMAKGPRRGTGGPGRGGVMPKTNRIKEKDLFPNNRTKMS